MKCRTCGTTLSSGALLCGECGTSAIAPRPTLGDTAHHDRRALLAAIAAERRVVAPRPAGPAHAAVEEPQRPPAGVLYSLVFSTGESIRVSGGGLVGRNPVAAPGEHPEYLVQVVDPGRSVSKTHLEFGVDEHGFWIADRGSSNGTRLAPDGIEPVELTPGERTRVPRGTRVGLGDQFFDLH